MKEKIVLSLIALGLVAFVLFGLYLTHTGVEIVTKTMVN